MTICVCTVRVWNDKEGKCKSTKYKHKHMVKSHNAIKTNRPPVFAALMDQITWYKKYFIQYNQLLSHQNENPLSSLGKV